MDTSSHIMIGLGLGALAQIDPSVANNPSLTQAVICGTVIGSNAPDFDIVFKLRGKSSYCKHHRGWSHSLLALPMWGLAVSSCIYLFFPDTAFLSLFLWTLLSVIIHVFLDVLNVYGTQALKPFTSKRIALDSISLFDPYIALLHIAGFSMMTFFEPGKTFLIIYLLMILYLFCRIIYARFIKKTLNTYFVNTIQIKLIPRAEFLKWGLYIETKEDFLFGTYKRNQVIIEHTLPKQTEFPDIVLDSKQERPISDFLTSTDYAYPFVEKRKHGHFVFWKDLRFRNKKFFPYLAVLFISSDSKEKNSYIGRINTLKQYKKVLTKLKANDSPIKQEH